MKRALALLEQQKQKAQQQEESSSSTTPNSQNLSKNQKRNPSAQRLLSDQKQSFLPQTISQTSNPSLNNPSGDPMLKTEISVISSRKSTAVSSTSRLGSGKGGTHTHKIIRQQTSDVVGGNIGDKEKLTVIETSLAKKKPPSKLKPLAQKANDKLQDFLGDYETSAQRFMLSELEDEMKEYLNPKSIMSQMQNVFGGSNTTISKSSTLKQKKKSVKQVGELEPILEESKIINQIVPYQPNMTMAEQRAKKNELLKKQVQKLTNPFATTDSQNSSSQPSQYSSSFQGSNPTEDTNTFVTAVKGKDQKLDPNSMQLVPVDPDVPPFDESQAWKPKKYYKLKEDELLDEVEQYEREMNDMYKYLNEVEELIKSNDLMAVQSMMDVTKETMNVHFTAYDKLKDQIILMDKQAEEAISALESYDRPSSEQTSTTTDRTRVPIKRDYNLQRIDEKNKDSDASSSDDESEVQIKTRSSQPTNAIENSKQNPSKKGKKSQEHNKKDIVTKLMNINQNMKDFSHDIEQRLDKVYKTGAGSKFGYSSVTNLSQQSDGGENSDGEVRKLNKIAHQAQSYLENNNILGNIGGVGLSKESKKLGAIKALPPSGKEGGAKKRSNTASKNKTKALPNADLNLQN